MNKTTDMETEEKWLSNLVVVTTNFSLFISILDRCLLFDGGIFLFSLL